jgi:2'-5' RNA ligase
MSGLAVSARGSIRRVFVGLGLDAAARQAATAVVEALRRCASGPEWRARFVLPADLHATLVFVGEVDAAAIPRVAAALDVLASRREVCALAGAPLCFDRVEAVPERGAPRLAWLRATQGEKTLASLADIVIQTLRAAGVPIALPPHRAFRGHVTLVRFDRVPAEARARLAGLSPASVRLVLDHTALFETLSPPARRASPEGARYAVLHRIPLSGRGAALAEALSPAALAPPSVATR